MKAKEIVLAVLLIVAGIFFYYARTGKFDFTLGWDNDFFHWSQKEFVSEESQEISSPLPPELQVINAHGQVEIQGTETDKVTISFTKRIWRKNEEDARNIADRLKMVINQDDLRLVIATNREEFRRRPFETNFKISVPAGIKVLVKNSYGLVKTNKTGTTEIKNSHGTIFASDVSGSLALQNNYEDIEVYNVQSGCQIESSYSSVTAINIKGETLIQHRYGNLHFEDLAQKTTVVGSHTEILGKNLFGQVEVESSYEKISLFNVGPTKIRAHHCDVDVNGAKEILDIEDNYGRVKAENIQGNLKIDGNNLEVFGQSILGQEIFIISSYQNVELSQFSGKTTISLSHGDVILEPASITGSIEVKADYADIRFYWPWGGKNPVEARAKSGNIKWELSEKPSVEETNGISVTKAFLEEKEKPSIFLSTSYGDIRLEELSRQEKSI